MSKAINNETGEVLTEVQIKCVNAYKSVYTRRNVARAGKDKSKYEGFHLEFEGKDVKVVSDGIVDLQAEISSNAVNAGLVNIMKLQEMRYGTLDNAIIRNKEKQVFGDVSKVGLSLAEDEENVKKSVEDVNELAKKLGCTADELLKMSQTDLYNKIVASQKALEPKNENGGNE